MTIGYLFVISNNFCFIIVSSHAGLNQGYAVYTAGKNLLSTGKMDSSAERLSSIQATALPISKYLHSPNLQEIPLPGHQLKGNGLINP